MKKSLLNFFNICVSFYVISCPQANLTGAIFSADTYNERHVQQQLNSILFPPLGLATALAEISVLPPSDQRKVLDDLTGEQYTNMVQSNQVASQQFMRRMYDSVRYDSLGLRCGQNCDQFQIWTAVGGGQAYQHRSHGAKGFNLDDWYVTVGAEKPLNFCFLNSWLTIGLAASYERDNIHFNQGGHGQSNNWQGAIYYMWNNCKFYSFSATILGSDRVEFKRPIRFAKIDIDRRARSRTYLTQWTSYSEAGLNLNWNCIYIQPFVGFEYAYYRRHALSEHHARFFGLHIRGKNVSATIGRLGLHLTTKLPCWDLLLSGDIAWRCRFNFLQERIQANFQHFGSRFRIKGVHQKPHGVEGAVNIAKCICDSWQIYVEGSGEKWERYSAWNVAGGLTFTW